MRPSRAEMLVEWRDATGGDHLSLTEWGELRKSLLKEEAKEACDAIDYYVLTGDARPLAKELADVDYVTEGAAQRPGIDLEVAFYEVHRSNMTKVAFDGKVHARADGKILKGPNYQEPNMAKAINPSGWTNKGVIFLDGLEGAIRSVPLFSRVALILFVVGSVGWAILSIAYNLAGGR